jgi:hypothetical protein
MQLTGMLDSPCGRRVAIAGAVPQTATAVAFPTLAAHRATAEALPGFRALPSH